MKQGDYYWLNAPAIDSEEPICIGQYSRSVQGPDKWYIGGKFYTAGIGINVIKRISKPKIKN